jgi:hypothetical protein
VRGRFYHLMHEFIYPAIVAAIILGLTVAALIRLTGVAFDNTFKCGSYANDWN